MQHRPCALVYFGAIECRSAVSYLLDVRCILAGVLMATERESVNFKLPKSLVDSLRDQAKERNTSATDLVIQGLHLILGQTESLDFSSPDVMNVMHDIITRLEALEEKRATDATATVNGIEDRLHQIETVLEHLALSIELCIESTGRQQLSERLSNLETKLEAIALRLDQLTNALGQLRLDNRNTGRRQFSPSSNQFYPRQVEIQSYTQENLASRLGIDAATLTRERENKSASEFESWSRNRDPSSLGWRWSDDGLYNPIR